MLFSVHSDIATGKKDFFEMNPGARAIPEFSTLTSNQMFAVTLIADRDYDSPLRTLSEKVRREKAVLIAGYKREPDGKRPDKNARNIIDGKVESVEAAIKKYYEIQYDEEKAILSSLNTQIKEAIDLMQLDKREACKVVKTKYNKVQKETTKEEYVDMAMVMKLTKDAMTIGIPLQELKKTRDNLQRELEKSAPIDNLMTGTVVDIIGEEDAEEFVESDNNLTTLDKYMEKQRTVQKND